ncbi:SRPBCC family protein [Demequina activiva]|uniref:Cyclase n=1 Tax=Demequina activiva TaxID=1582364 RepID=A0A919Q4A1_9MICO|nr:SRPBCC family protein [Demequina activiva]GIG53585.1 hypothetical protein Dac01nite_03370 [Demequina activiva]
MPSFTVTTAVAAPVARAFALSLSVDAHAASLAHSGERAVAGVTTGQLAEGESVTWRARHFGVWFTMTSRITEHQPPHRFVDEQVAGPFQRWRHEHRFEMVPEGTLMVDHVDFAAPLGLLGRAVEALVLTRYMERLITRRSAWLAQALSEEAA